MYNKMLKFVCGDCLLYNRLECMSNVFVMCTLCFIFHSSNSGIYVVIVADAAALHNNVCLNQSRGVHIFKSRQTHTHKYVQLYDA